MNSYILVSLEDPGHYPRLRRFASDCGFVVADCSPSRQQVFLVYPKGNRSIEKMADLLDFSMVKIAGIAVKEIYVIQVARRECLPSSPDLQEFSPRSR